MDVQFEIGDGRHGKQLKQLICCSVVVSLWICEIRAVQFELRNPLFVACPAQRLLKVDGESWLIERFEHAWFLISFRTCTNRLQILLQ